MELLKNGINFRSLGVIENSSIKIKSGFIYRSGELTKLTLEEALFLKSNLHIQHYLDLRSVKEIQKTGSPENILNAGIQWKTFSFNVYDDSHINILSPGASEYSRYYLEILYTGSKTIVNFLNFVASNECSNFIFGCYAGKDRTGVMAVILLEILGYSINEIAYDYALSVRYLLRQVDFFSEKWKKKNITKEEYLIRLKTQEETIYLLYEYLNEYYGGFVNFLKKIGVEQTVISAIRQKYSNNKQS